MKRILILGFMFALFAFSVNPVQSVTLLEDDARLEQTDVVIDIADATQTQTISILDISCQVAAPLKYPTVLAISNNIIEENQVCMLQSNMNRMAASGYIITSNEIKEKNSKDNMKIEGLFMPNVGKNLNVHLS